MMSDSFIESVITTETESTKTDRTMISRQFDGIEAVAQFDKEERPSQESDN